MTGWTFVPDAPAGEVIEVPFFEDARKDAAPYYAATRSIDSAKNEIVSRLNTLGASILSIESGTYVIDNQQRLGFTLHFMMTVGLLNGTRGMIRIAGLPMRSPSEDKARRVRVQALLIVADWLKAVITARVFSPDAHPLIPFLTAQGADGKPHTVAEMAAQLLTRPLLPEKSEVAS